MCLALPAPVSSFSPVPPLIKTGDPDFDLIRTKVAEAVGKSEALDKGSDDGDGEKSDTPSSVSPSKKASTPSKTPSKPSTDVDDVAQVCKA